MARKPNTKCNGKDFSKDEERAVWEKAEIVYTLSPNPSAIPYIVGGVPLSSEVKNFDKDSPEYNIRKDKCGATIHFSHYQLKRNSITVTKSPF